MEAKRFAKKDASHTLLVETAWEVCNPVGGIYTVIHSKLDAVLEKWGANYCLLGPYFHDRAMSLFEPLELHSNSPFAKTVKQLRKMGLEVHYGKWLVQGRPTVILFNPFSLMNQLDFIKQDLWKYHNIPTGHCDDLLNQTLCFGQFVKLFFNILAQKKITTKKIIAHFHEWMAGSAIPSIRGGNLKITTVFTTHATIIGRYLAMNDSNFYKNLHLYDWEYEARHFNIEAQTRIERAAAHGAHVFSTVSEVTGRECTHLIGRTPDIYLPNGINIERFEALHEFQNLHKKYKDQIHRFTMSHFFQSYTFDLDKTLYFFTSGRYEYKIKGYDLTIEALAKLNWKLQQINSDITIVMFIVTRKPFYSINPEVFHSRALMTEIRLTCDAIQKQVGERLFRQATKAEDNKLPSLDLFVDDYWRLRFRRTLQAWKSSKLPPIVTHNLVDDNKDEVLSFLRSSNLINNQHDRVKVVYHPDFISTSSPLFGMEYGQFVRGCHMGVFPSYYEPWGYTPLECIASGVPAVTSNLAGFGDFASKKIRRPNEHGVYIINRQEKDFYEAANELADDLFQFTLLTRRERIKQRNRVENSSVSFGWKNLIRHYEQAYTLALERLK